MKRGTSGLSLIVGVNKPSGMSSHDVVNRCRRIFGERRVGHTGTLDPLACGVLPVCIGPATRLGMYLTSHDKYYRVTIAFGVGTDTDDSQGEVIARGTAPECAYSEEFATSCIAGLVGKSQQIPPLYSAIKVDGTKSYEAARRGVAIDLEPRDIEVYSARLLSVSQPHDQELLTWDVEFHVSKGTYIRALARDIGAALCCPAHVTALERIQSGLLTLEECVSLETLEELKEEVALDPVKLLGIRFMFVQDEDISKVKNGMPLLASANVLHEYCQASLEAKYCSCSSSVKVSSAAPRTNELIAVIAHNTVIALYSYCEESAVFKPTCVFQTGVSRGGNY